MILLTLVASTFASMGRGTGPAGADQIADLRTEATTVSQQLIHGQLQVEAYQQQVSVASARVAADARAIAQLGVQVGQDQQQISARSDQVRSLAVRSYMDYGTGVSSADAALFSSSQEHAQVASEYSAIAVGNITTAVAELRTAQRTFQAHQATLQRQQGQDRADQTHQATFLEQANTTQHQLEALQARVTGQLAAAVAQQSAAQSATAAAAVAAAQRSATKAPTGAPTKSPASTVPASTSTGAGSGPAPTTTTPAAPTNTTDPALNPFLQCVVQAESGGNYAAVSPDGLYMGAFQFAQSTWDIAASAAGRPDLVGVPPNRASKADQDTVAVALYALDGQRPWLGDRCVT